jgi:hypothetical protein
MAAYQASTGERARAQVLRGNACIREGRQHLFSCFSQSSPLLQIRTSLVRDCGPIVRPSWRRTTRWRSYSPVAVFGASSKMPQGSIESFRSDAQSLAEQFPFLVGGSYSIRSSKDIATVSPTVFPIAWRMFARTGSLCVPSPRAMNELRKGCRSILPLTFTKPRVPKNLTELGQTT